VNKVGYISYSVNSIPKALVEIKKTYKKFSKMEYFETLLYEIKEKKLHIEYFCSMRRSHTSPINTYKDIEIIFVKVIILGLFILYFF